MQQRVDKLKAPILCLVGAPGVGKTSLGQSIARATNRKFVRMSLGGVRDEAEIRGHRRTYIGSMPGKILQNMTKVGVRNPLFLLDEVDKMGMDFRGDPSSALLEVLDPEQNHTFVDHYVEVEYDLSDVMFVATANTLNIPPPLLDRMEVIRLSGYTEDEKVHIAMQYLLPKQIKTNGLKEGELTVTEAALRDIVRYYTREAGVRGLEREISKICRKVVKAAPHRQEATRSAHASPVNAEEPRQVPRRAPVHLRHRREEEPDRPGHRPRVDRGRRRAADIEAVTHARQGQDDHHRQARRRDAGVDPGGALGRARALAQARHRRRTSIRRTTSTSTCPKARRRRTARSAGIGIATAMVSVLTGIPVRCDVAMTGEITLRGEVLPIGGLKEKLLAAHRGGIKTRADPGGEREGPGRDPGQRQEPLEIIPVQVDRPGARDARSSASPSRCPSPTSRRRSRPSPTTRPARSSRTERFTEEGSVNKADLIEQIAQAAEISKSAAERAVDATGRGDEDRACTRTRWSRWSASAPSTPASARRASAAIRAPGRSSRLRQRVYPSSALARHSRML